MFVGWDVAVVFGFPIIIVALALGYAAFHRFLRHRERMAMIEKGMMPADWDEQEAARRTGRDATSPVTITLVGIAVTLGLLTLGIGPWLIGGLVPTAYGCALLIREMRAESKDKHEGE